MINTEELLFVTDKNNNPLEPLTRKLVHKQSMWHRTSGIWVLNKYKQILCQKRSLKKDIKPGIWEAFFGGHISPGEDYVDNAVSEIEEELGLEILKEDLIFYKVLSSDKPTHKEFQGIFALVLDSKTDNFKFEKEEIEELKWYDLKNIEEILLDPLEVGWVHKPWDKDILFWLENL